MFFLETFFDDRFTEVSEECRKFALIGCGPGGLKSRHFFLSGQKLYRLSPTKDSAAIGAKA